MRATRIDKVPDIKACREEYSKAYSPYCEADGLDRNHLIKKMDDEMKKQTLLKYS
jgi:hypothetical protein